MLVLARFSLPAAFLDIRLRPAHYEVMDDVTRTPAPTRRTKPKGRHPHKRLSAAFVRSAPPGRHCDGNGLYLYVQPSGARSWVQRLVIRGRRRDFGLGSVALVSLAEAREKARANRKLAREGGDPLAERRRARSMPSFAEAAERVMEQKRSGWRSQRHARGWMASLKRYAFPRIGGMPISEVTSGDVLEILAPIWHVKAPTAKVLRQRIRTVLEWARRDGVPAGQPGRPRGTGPGTAGRDREAQAGAAASRGVFGGHEGARLGRGARRQARFRVLGAHGGEVGRDPVGRVDGDQSDGWRLDGARDAHEGEPRTPGAFGPPRLADSR